VVSEVGCEELCSSDTCGKYVPVIFIYVLLFFLNSLKIDSFRSLRKPERSMSDDKENQRYFKNKKTHLTIVKVIVIFPDTSPLCC